MQQSQSHSLELAKQTLAAVQALYDEQIQVLREGLTRFLQGEDTGRIRAFYPQVSIETSEMDVHSLTSFETQAAFGFVAGAGKYSTSLTRPDLFASYYLEQFELLLRHHGVQLQVSLSDETIPIHFALGDQTLAEAELSHARRQLLRLYFDVPDLSKMDDSIANGTNDILNNDAKPLALFTAQRVDVSLQRLRHYTGTSPESFQQFVLFTNYQFYMEEFIRLGAAEMQNPDSEYIAFIEPGDKITWRVGYTPAKNHGYPQSYAAASTGTTGRLPQMPALHLVKENNEGITLINIGVGPANAKNITDHVAVLRPHAWIMVGHCAGLQNSQQLGDYVLAHGYVREDHVLDDDLPPWVPIPALAEVQLALQEAVAQVAGVQGVAVKSIMRTGTVASTDNRNWELLEHRIPLQLFRQSRAIALDMESATIAANGFRFRVPYGTLLCVSDKPLSGEIKLPGMANHFYRARVLQHLRIGLKAIELLQKQEAARLHSRKLRSYADVAFR